MTIFHINAKDEVDKTIAGDSSQLQTTFNQLIDRANEPVVATGSGGSALTIQDDGTDLTTPATTLNFTGAGVTASGIAGVKTITIPGGGAGGDAILVYEDNTAYAVGDIVVYLDNDSLYRVNTAVPSSNTSAPSLNSSFTRISNPLTEAGNAVIEGNFVIGFGDRTLVTALPLTSFTWNLSRNPSFRFLNWDETPGTITYTATNSTDYEDEYASQVISATRGSTALTVSDAAPPGFVASKSYAISQNALEGTNQYDGRDTRAGSISAGGGRQDIVVTWRTNLSDTNNRTSSSGFQWRSAPAQSRALNLGALNFDAILTSYTLNISYGSLSNSSTVASHTVSPSSGFGSPITVVSPGLSRNYSFTSLTIYHDDTVSGSITGSIVRPTSVSASPLANRTLSRNASFSTTPATQYKAWGIRSTTSADTWNVTFLGTLGNSGYATAATHTSTSQTGWRSNTFTSPTADATPDTFFVVVPRPSGTVQWRNPNTNYFIIPNATTNITLGHSGHTLPYTVYTFTIPANTSLTMRVV